LNFVRRALLLSVGVAALVIAARFAAGPHWLMLPVATPVNAEGIFGALLTILLAAAARSRTGATPAAPAKTRLAVALTASVILISAIAFARSLSFSFLSDDFIIVARAATLTPASLLKFFTNAAGDGFYRPLGAVSFALESLWAGFDPVRWHALSLAFHAVNAVLVLWLAWRLGASRFAGLFAAILFAVHGSRPENVVWIASRYDLLATIFVLAGLLFFLRARGAVGRGGLVWHAAAFFSMVLALLSKESAFIFPLLLVVVTLVNRAGLRRSLRSLSPYFAGTAAVFLWRWSLFGGIGGYLVPKTGRPLALSLSLAPTLKAVFVRLWTALYFPINWSQEPGLVLGALAAGYMICLIWLAAKSRPTTPLWIPAAFVVISVIPPLHLLGIGPDLWKSRILYLSSAGFCLLLALAADHLTRPARFIVPGVILAFQFAALQHNLDSWEYASSKVAPACEAAARSLGPSSQVTAAGIPRFMRGVPAFANGFEECVELRLGRDIQATVIRDASGAAAPPNTTLLVWDPATDQLKCAQGCF
jgi:hypothetical protein